MSEAGLPPEVISGLMYAGAGSGPLLAATAAWDTLASELHTTAMGYQSVVSALTGSWMGPSSVLMASAAAPYVSWLHTTAGQAEKVAIQAKAAAAAFETAFAATVPPPAIAANRAELATLVATNLLGQNTAAIAANQAEYAAMWAQDVAMFATYTISSLTAVQMEPFQPPPKTTNEAGQAAQAGDAVKNVGTVGAQQVLTRMSDAGGSAASQALAGPAAEIAPLDITLPGGITIPFPDLAEFLIPDLAGLLGLIAGVGGGVASLAGLIVSAGAWIDAVPGVLENERRLDHLHAEHHEMLDVMGRPRPDWWRPGMWPWTEGAMGNAAQNAGLSVPPAWGATVPQIAPVAAALPMSAAGPAVSGASGAAFRDLAMASMLGRALAGGVSPAAGSLGVGKGGKVGQVAKEAAAAAVAETVASPAARTGIADELRQLAHLRDEGVLTGEEFLEQKRRLLE
ncbi:PPE domain-containing protein [Mycolicibacillus parakoreensis]|uniref:PPE domain-containing protein n=1 Tax=Mycolicibacillus parakoreensis TaxID=1069221 RepID=A0ABY3TZL7_9MYCO|nr:PPE domain-containing protein [Mycolicibacillus parakoreensis]MCV7316054.1 PPE domain-containing protein [Mycolicibacillus parakoreensis]ULN52324.1 PPE domain-containing protein [Mycolicibacillus parakoreensis]